MASVLAIQVFLFEHLTPNKKAQVRMQEEAPALFGKRPAAGYCEYPRLSLQLFFQRAEVPEGESFPLLSSIQIFELHFEGLFFGAGAWMAA
jgi:hypothetical protein